jgi:hypothetical protein
LHFLSESRPGRASILMLQKDISLGPGLVGDPCRPALEGSGVIVQSAKPEVSPCGCASQRRSRTLRLTFIDRDEGDIPSAEDIVDFRIEPGGVAELDGSRPASRKPRQEIGQPGQVFFEGRGELEQGGAEAFAQRVYRAKKIPERSIDIGQPVIVCYPARP